MPTLTKVEMFVELAKAQGTGVPVRPLVATALVKSVKSDVQNGDFTDRVELGRRAKNEFAQLARDNATESGR